MWLLTLGVNLARIRRTWELAEQYIWVCLGSFCRRLALSWNEWGRSALLQCGWAISHSQGPGQNKTHREKDLLFSGARTLFFHLWTSKIQDFPAFGCQDSHQFPTPILHSSLAFCFGPGASWFWGLQTWVEPCYGHLTTPVCKWTARGLLSLHNCVSQFS